MRGGATLSLASLVRPAAANLVGAVREVARRRVHLRPERVVDDVDDEFARALDVAPGVLGRARAVGLPLAARHADQAGGRIGRHAGEERERRQVRGAVLVERRRPGDRARQDGRDLPEVGRVGRQGRGIDLHASSLAIELVGDVVQRVDDHVGGRQVVAGEVSGAHRDHPRAGGARRQDPGRRVLDRDRSRGADAEARDRLRVRLGRRLAVRVVLGGDEHREVVGQADARDRVPGLGGAGARDDRQLRRPREAFHRGSPRRAARDGRTPRAASASRRPPRRSAGSSSAAASGCARRSRRSRSTSGR